MRHAKEGSKSPKKENCTQTFESEEETDPKSYLQSSGTKKSHKTRNAERTFGKEEGQRSQEKNLGCFLRPLAFLWSTATPSHFVYSL